MTLSIEKVNLLKKIFWEMNEITSSIEEKKSDMLGQNSKKKILTITIKGKSIDEMKTKYMFNQNQKLQVDELLKKEYDSLWSSVLYGSSIGNSNLSQIAANEIGNKGGKKYWSWYGFESRIEWCAVFVSWVANQAGYIDNGTIPKFTTCRSQGVPWFKNRGQWKERGYVPNSGDIIFFDWQQDGVADHVGIVERVENNIIYTIEGNSDDEVKRNNYNINSKDIYGFGIPTY